MQLDGAMLSLIENAKGPGMKFGEICIACLALKIGARSRIKVRKTTVWQRLRLFEESGFIIHDGDYYRKASWLARELAIGVPAEIKKLLPKLKPLDYSHEAETVTVHNAKEYLEPHLAKFWIIYWLFLERLLSIEDRTAAYDSAELFVKLIVDSTFARITKTIWNSRKGVSLTSIQGTTVKVRKP